MATAASLAGCGSIVHGFSTAAEGSGEPFDLGSSDSRDALVLSRRRQFLAAIGLAGAEFVAPLQVHEATVVRACGLDPERPPEADAVVALGDDRPRRAVGVRSADCVPILLAAEDGGAVAAIHAGWRGTAAGVARRAVEALADLGVAPGRLRAAMGPAIGPCCYEVSVEVARAVASATEVAEERVSSPDSRTHGRRLDLRLANSLQLQAAGRPGSALESAPGCSGCTVDRFFSHRRQGPRAGRMMACIGWPP